MINVYRQCLQVQNACNYTGIAMSFGKEIVPVLCDERTWARDRGLFMETQFHPVALWWTCKLLDLASFSLDHYAGSGLLSLAMKYLKLLAESKEGMLSDEHFEHLKAYYAKIHAMMKGEKDAIYEDLYAK